MAGRGFGSRIKALFGIGVGKEEFYEELLDSLIEGDFGARTAMEAVDALKESAKRKKLSTEGDLRTEMRSILSGIGREIKLVPAKGKLSVYLVLGVNGVGKTTSIAKLAHRLMGEGVKDILLAAGDTFRAGAIDQLKHHGERLGLRVVAQGPGSDSGAVIHDAITAAKAAGAELVLADTAGRMHTKQNLVKELEKVDKIVTARVAPEDYKKILVLDATTGQNGLRQAEVFHGSVGIDALILSKYDSSARGGLALSVARDFGIPVAFLGVGEGYGDLRPFELSPYLDEFLGG